LVRVGDCKVLAVGGAGGAVNYSGVVSSHNCSMGDWESVGAESKEGNNDGADWELHLEGMFG